MKRPPALAAYAALTGALEPLAPALLRARARRGKEDVARLGERLGRSALPRPAGPLVWLHGASVGESLSLLPVTEALLTARPGLAVVVTSVTVTAAELLAKRLPAGAMHQYAPLDTPAAARRFVAHWRPDLAVFVESELWPNVLWTAKAAGARLALISARMSEKSAAGWARAPESARVMLGLFDLVLTQDEPSARRLTALGARDDGWINLKRVGAALPVDAEALAEAERRAAGRPVLLAASTHPGEDAFALSAFGDVPAEALLVLVPRHPVRGPEVRRLAVERGFGATLQSAGEAFGDARVHVADALGELGLWMRLSRAAWVGGGIAPRVGGHNPLEPARLDRPIASGPSVENWRDVYRQLDARQAVRWTAEPDALAAFWREAAADAPELRAQAERASALTRVDDGAFGATMGKLLALLP